MSEPVVSRLTADQMHRHRELQRKSGLTISAYCKRESINPSSWWYWRKRLLSKKHYADQSAQAPISFLQLPTQSPDTQKFDLTLPNGARISMPLSCQLDFLRQVVRTLSCLRPR
jgi:transposase-like protein